MLLFQADQLRQFGERIFVAAGTEPGQAAIVVDHLINANLTGHDSHGVQHIPGYVGSIQRGRIRPNARPDLAEDRGIAAIVDGAWTFGQISALFAAELSTARAKERGLCLVALQRANHIGRLGEYTARAAANGVVLLVTVGGTARAVAPFGGKCGALATNPFSVGFPAGEHTNFMLDFATSMVAAGKVMVAKAKHEQLAPGVLLDGEGNPTTDPNALVDGGALVAFGAHKGSGLSILSALLSQVLVNVPAYADDNGQSAACFLAIDSAIFRPRADVERDAAAVLQKIKSVPPAVGHTDVLIPGEPEAMSYARRLQEGIPVPEDTWNAIRETAATLGLDLPVLSRGGPEPVETRCSSCRF
jgi:LDH2 family malate/lactate/ureidoglycolate dehydrogenase